MFWKKKEIQNNKKENETKEDNKSPYYKLLILKRKTRHAKTIIENKLYDTEKGKLFFLQDNRLRLYGA